VISCSGVVKFTNCYTLLYFTLIMRRHISDTHAMHSEIYYVHPHSGDMLFADTIHWVEAGRPATTAVCSGKNLQTNIHR